MALPDRAQSVRVSPNGRHIAVSLAGASSADGSIAVIDLHNSAAAQTLLKNGSAVGQLSWHPRLDWIAAPCADGVIRIWDTVRETLLQAIPGHVDRVMEAVWNPEGDIIASHSGDGTLKLWDACTGEVFVTLEHPMGPLVFSDDGTRLGPGLDGSGVRLFEVAPLEICRRLRSPPDSSVWSAAFSDDGGLLATVDKKVRLWNKAGYELATLPFVNPRSVLFGKDSMIVTGHDGVVRWPLRTETDGKTARVVLGAPQRLAERGHEWEFAAISSNEKLLAVASTQEVALLSLSEPKPPKFLRGHTGASRLALSPDGKYVATGSATGGEVWVWNCGTDGVEARLPVRGGACVAFTSDGKSLITGSAEEFRCWEVKSWKAGASHLRRDDMPGSIAISPRGTAAAIAYRRHSVRLVDQATLTTVCEPDCGPHTPLCFSRDGSIVVSANTKGHVFMWDLARIRNQLAQLRLDWYFPPLKFSKAPLVETVVLP
jgi:WD40 repeat protein